jgi:hypothetical protein
MSLPEMVEFCRPPANLEGAENAFAWLQYLNDVWGHIMGEIGRKEYENELLSFDEVIAIGALRDAYVTVKNAFKSGLDIDSDY